MAASGSPERRYRSGEYERIALGHPGSEESGHQSNPFNSTSLDLGDQPDAFSMHSTTPLTPPVASPGTYPPMPTNRNVSGGGSVEGMPLPHDYASRGRAGGVPPGAMRPQVSQQTTAATGMSGPTRAHRSHSSWDLLDSFRKMEQEYEEFDTRHARKAHLRFAKGDMPDNKVVKLYNYLLNVSVVTRWILFILPVMAIIWIPGILGFTKFPDATIWEVKFMWWSIWVTIVWGGWWAALAFARFLPRILRNTVGVIAVDSLKYISWIASLNRYVALFAWTIANWVSYNPLISRNRVAESSEVSLLSKILVASMINAGILLAEKFSIQWIAGKFHERSYADRISEQKTAVRILVTMYSHSSDIPGRIDTLKDRDMIPKEAAVDPKKLFKRALKGVRVVATTTTTALGNVASEIAGTSVLQPNSPQAMVQAALRSANKTRLLARRLYYSFRKSGNNHIEFMDIAQFFETKEQADAAFALFDKDDNGDVTREELENACLECHREQLSLEHSMSDLDSAVGRLDNILITLVIIIALLIFVVALDAQFESLITGTGTFILGLSWLIGLSCQEILASIIFLFIKHPYDVGDRVDIDTNSYTVKEIRLLSTVFLDSNNSSVQAAHNVLTTKFIRNIRRSPQMSETFEFEVAYGTTFDQIEQLRSKMLAFVKSERRDFLPSFDVVVKDIPEQEKMILSSDIKYKSNWQQGSVKVKRRNKWMCALKASLAELKIYGPKGDPDTEPAPTVYTQVPWNEVLEKREEEKRKKSTAVAMPEPLLPKTDYHFMDRNATIMDDNPAVYGETEQMYMTNPRSGTDSLFPTAPSTPTTAQRPSMPFPAPTPPMPTPARVEGHPATTTISTTQKKSGQSYV